MGFGLCSTGTLSVIAAGYMPSYHRLRSSSRALLDASKFSVVGHLAWSPPAPGSIARSGLRDKFRRSSSRVSVSVRRIRLSHTRADAGKCLMPYVHTIYLSPISASSLASSTPAPVLSLGHFPSVIPCLHILTYLFRFLFHVASLYHSRFSYHCNCCVSFTMSVFLL